MKKLVSLALAIALLLACCALPALAEEPVTLNMILQTASTYNHGDPNRDMSVWEAIEKACKKLGGWRLHRCDLYVTLEPCPMCAGAIINARIKTVYFGAFDPKAGSCGSMINLFSLPYNHQPELVSGVMEEQCADELRTFFRELRKKRKLIRKAQKSEEAAAESGKTQQNAFCEREK